MPDQPSIICFITDQHRADHLGCYGNRQVRTPNIDRLAAEGITFTESYVANPVCMPNRATMFTGRYPKAHRLRENGNTLNPSEDVLPEVLRQNGYQTASIGKIHLAPFQLKQEAAEHEWELYETSQFWNSDRKLPLPYYGLENVCLVDGHGPYAFGDYKRWLDDKHPGAYEKLSKQFAIEPLSGAKDSWKASVPEELHYNTFIADRTIEYLQGRDASKPFFLWCSFPDPHHPFSPPKPYCDMYDPEEIDFHPARRPGEMDDLPDYIRKSYEGKMVVGGLHGGADKVTDEHYREIHALTYGMISMVDTQIGRIIQAMESLDLLEDTVILFFSDHGDLMGDHWLINKGPYLYRGLVRVPTVCRLPGGASGGRVSDALISTADLCPTLLDLAGAQIPDGVQGRSYKGILEGTEDSVRDWAYIEYDESYINDRLRQIRSHEWALTAHANRREGLLFDLKSDPDELHNLWDNPEYQSVKNELLAELYYQTSRADDWLPPKKTHA